MLITRRTALGGLVAAAAIRPAFAAPEKVTYLFPAPGFLPAFLPFQLALKRGYFTKNNLEVTFQTGRGGADVAKQVGVGNADLGGGLGETSMIVRPNDLPVRAVAQLGSHPLFKLVTRKESNVKSPKDLVGKKLGVIGYQDTGYYALLAVLAANGIKRDQLEIQAVGPAGVTQLMIAKSLDGIMATPEWAIDIEKGGVALDYFDVEKTFPAMAQAILSSDKFIKERPEAVRGFVHAVLQAVRDCMADQDSAVKDYVAAVPQHAGKEAYLKEILGRYVKDVYATEPASALGTFDPKRLATVQKFYVENQIIQKAVPVEDLYTNDFVK
ncbi:ABC transporter substrate-binding protein [Pseudolabrys taiwanensis]|uniref:ABC transporter substrate-binding protein n=1 Tax=Pseudolabrys taiwanensis TaxID=331696 RepID=A0A345ZTW1_9HYPH|nr:ABC transporter substrate-binding protein [Pseudolabrys taiwanensis]AXK80358.1 ABC transporter substrate-binding protein [Pseudolabrys taiwanensis]